MTHEMTQWIHSDIGSERLRKNQNNYTLRKALKVRRDQWMTLNNLITH